jgi:hypothetical protein
MSDLQNAVRMLAGAQDSYRARALIFLAGLLDDVDRGAGAVEHVRLFGTTADREASELGVEREVPLIRVILARALLARDGLPAAARCAAAVLEATQAMSLSFPFAFGLETAMVLHAAGVCGDRAVGEFLATAALIRRTGDRPAPATLARAVTELRAVLGSHAATAVALEVLVAVSSAIALLASVASA